MARPFRIEFAGAFDLEDWTGRAVRADKCGAIPVGMPTILSRLGLEPASWIEEVQHFRRHFFDHVAPPQAWSDVAASWDGNGYVTRACKNGRARYPLQSA